MKNKNLFRTFALCTLSALLAVQTPVTIFADGEIAGNIETIDNGTSMTDPTAIPNAENPTNPNAGYQDTNQFAPGGAEGTGPAGTDASGSSDAATGAPGADDGMETDSSAEMQEALPITAAIAVSGEAGDLTLALTVTNGSFINENIPDFTAMFCNVPAGVVIGLVGQTENTVTFHISGNAASYTREDLLMTIPGSWLKDTADQVVIAETPVEGHDYFWFAHADFGIRLKSKAETVDNAAFAAQQNLVDNPKDYDTIRFVYKKMDLKVFTGKTDILESPAEDAKVVGHAEKDQSLYEIMEVRGGWLYVESGRVRGFVKKEQVSRTEKDLRHRRKVTAKETVPASENAAYNYVRITGNNPLVTKEPRLTAKALDIKEEMKADSRTIGTIGKEGILYWLSYEPDGWMYVESGDVRGFVQEKDLLSLQESQEKIEHAANEGADPFVSAEKTVEPEENKALYYRMISSKKGDIEGVLREQIVELAKVYIGNPYVYGGTDPVHGIDCSAFMQFLFGNYGISLPRTSKSQGFAGRMVKMESLDKGDIIIYADDAEIYHVALYAGDGKTVEAADETQGIVSKDVNVAAAVWGISLLDEVDGLTMP